MRKQCTYYPKLPLTQYLLRTGAILPLKQSRAVKHTRKASKTRV